MFNFLVYYTGTIDVEDLAQETFIRALKGLAQYRGQTSPKSWLFAIARNLVIDTVRKKQRLKESLVETLAELPSGDRTPEEIVEAHETAKSVLNLIHQVSPKHRDVLLLRGIYDLPVSEVAMTLGITQTAVNVRYHRAIKLAQKLLEIPNERGVKHGS